MSELYDLQILDCSAPAQTTAQIEKNVIKINCIIKWVQIATSTKTALFETSLFGSFSCLGSLVLVEQLDMAFERVLAIKILSAIQMAWKYHTHYTLAFLGQHGFDFRSSLALWKMCHAVSTKIHFAGMPKHVPWTAF
jgi:hypothetical protein